eukprot:scaffold23942_cov112-Isochrysis_galbana.AAC.1
MRGQLVSGSSGPAGLGGSVAGAAEETVGLRTHLDLVELTPDGGQRLAVAGAREPEHVLFLVAPFGALALHLHLPRAAGDLDAIEATEYYKQLVHHVPRDTAIGDNLNRCRRDGQVLPSWPGGVRA